MIVDRRRWASIQSVDETIHSLEGSLPLFEEGLGLPVETWASAKRGARLWLIRSQLPASVTVAIGTATTLNEPSRPRTPLLRAWEVTARPRSRSSSGVAPGPLNRRCKK